MSTCVSPHTSKSRARRLRASAKVRQLYIRDQESNHITCNSTDALIGTVHNLIIMLQSCVLYCPFDPSHTLTCGARDLWNEPYPSCGVASAGMSESTPAAVEGASSDGAVAAVEPNENCFHGVSHELTTGVSGANERVHHFASKRTPL